MSMENSANRATAQCSLHSIEMSPTARVARSDQRPLVMNTLLTGGYGCIGCWIAKNLVDKLEIVTQPKRLEPQIDSTAALTAPSVAHVAGAPTIASTTQLYPPTITVGAVDVTAGHVASTTTLYGPSLAAVIGDGTIGSGSTVTAPTLAYEVAAAHLGSTATLGGPTVSGEQAVVAGHCASTVTLYPPYVTQGIYAPRLRPGQARNTRVLDGANNTVLQGPNGTRRA